jgi:branched-chain amino acid aminotransferase
MEDPQVSVRAHALHYGSGAFEGIRAYATPAGTRIFRLDDHLERLRISAGVYRMEIPYSDAELTDAIWQTIDAANLDSCYIRPLVFRGAGQLGIYPLNCPVEVAIMVMPWGAYLGDHAIETGVRACMSPYRRFANDMMPSRAKASGQYLNSILAKLDSSDRGFEEAILLNEHGLVCEGTGENIFVVTSAGDVLTPSLDQSILPGITRRTVIDMLAYMGYEPGAAAAQGDHVAGIVECEVTVEDLAQAREVFLTGTAAEITPVRSIDGRPVGGDCTACEGSGHVAVPLGDGDEDSQVCDECLGDGHAGPGPVTRAVQELFFATVGGQDTEFSHLMQTRPES